MAHTRASLAVGRKIYMKVFSDAYEGSGPIGREGEYCFNLMSTTQDNEIVKMVDDFDYASLTAEGAAYNTETLVEMYTKTFAWDKYTKGYGWTEEAAFTDQYGTLRENAAKVARALRDTRAKSVSDVFNRAFDSTNYPGIDTVSLCHTAHPTAGGATWANRPALDVAFSAVAVGQAIQEMMTTKDRKNRVVPFSSKSLIIRNAPANHIAVATFLNSTLRPGTANNDANVSKDMVSGSYTDRLLTTNSAAWFLTDADKSNLGLFVMTGLPAQTTTKSSPENGTEYFYSSDSWVAAWYHARRLWGTNP